MSKTKPTFVRVKWENHSFHGLREDSQTSWPPAPMRLLGSLTGAAHRQSGGEGLDLIDKIASSPNPRLFLPDAIERNLPDSYLPPSLPAEIVKKLDLGEVIEGAASKNRVLKPVTGVSLSEPQMVFEIDADLSADEISTLRQLCADVFYFGRSHDVARLEVVESPELGRLKVYYPIEVSGGKVRGWSPRARLWMEENHRLAHSAGEYSLPPLSPSRYLIPLEYSTVSENSDVAIVSLPGRVRPKNISRFMSNFSSLQVFPAVNAGHQYSNGNMVGVGIIRSEGSPSVAEVARVIAGIEDARIEGGIPLDNAWALQPKRWMGSGTRFVSTTPYLCVPSAVAILYSLAQDLQVGVRMVSMSPNTTWRDADSQGLSFYDIEFETDEPLAGPVLAPTNQIPGSGWFMPIKEVK